MGPPSPVPAAGVVRAALRSPSSACQTCNASPLPPVLCVLIGCSFCSRKKSQKVSIGILLIILLLLRIVELPGCYPYQYTTIQYTHGTFKYNIE